MKRNIKSTKFRSFSISLLVLLLSTLAFSQNAFSQSKRLQRAIDKYNYQFYNEAISLFKEEVRENREAYTPLKYLANSYRKVKDYQNAELYFNLLVNSDSAQAEDYLYYGQALKSNGKLRQAKAQFIKFQELEESSFLSKLMLQSIDRIAEWDKERRVYRSIRMDWLNTATTEFGPLFFKDKFYITSNREESLTTYETSSYNEQTFLSIYEMDTSMLRKKIADFEEVYGRLNSPYHDGPLTISEDESIAMISRVDNQMGGKEFVNQMKMFEGEYSKDKWRNFKAFPHNSNKYSVGYAHYQDNGNTLYFASDMPGGEGGMDLYVCQRDGNDWSEPRNLGPAINTQNDEVFPFIKGKQLYFSSDGYPGYGELDIYVSDRTNDGWSEPENLKSPINSNRDDFGIYFKNDTSGYYASNREGGKGMDDIYGFIRYDNNIKISGVIESEGLPVKGTKVLLVNENDSVVGEAYTDDDGNFEFKNLAYQENYLIKIDSDEPELIESGRAFLTDEGGKKIQSIQRIETTETTGTFELTALPSDEIIELQALKAEDEVELADLQFTGKVFEKLPGDLKDEVMVYLLDTMGTVIDSTVTEEDGSFVFNRLPPSENYLLKVKEVDVPLNIAFINEEERVYNIQKMNKEGIITVEPTIDASKLIEEARNRGYTTLIGKLETKGKPISNTVVEIYDRNDSLISTVVTNEKGEFQYNMLEYDKHYFLKIPSLDEDLRDDALLYVVRDDGTPLYLINLIASGSYEFKSLPYEEYEYVQEEKRKMVPQEVALAGQLYSVDDSANVEGMGVYLIGEDGILRDSVRTDKEGKFKFEKLNPDEHYSFQLDRPANEFTLVLVDQEGNVIEKAFLSEDEGFKYEKLTYMVAQFDPLTVEEVKIYDEQYSHEVKAQVFRELPGDIGEGQKVFLYNEKGKLLETTTTDSDGKFAFTKLDPEQNYIFKLENDDRNYTMVTYDEEDKVVETKIKKEGAAFSYSPLGFIEHTIEEEETTDGSLVNLNQKEITEIKKVMKDSTLVYDVNDKEGSGFVFFYGFDKTTLSVEAKIKLDEFVKLFKEDTFKIKISSHTDQRGPVEYNVGLSKRRTREVSRYLKNAGITAARIIEDWQGESQPIVNCEETDCDNNDHRLNRRSEIKIVKESN